MQLRLHSRMYDSSFFWQPLRPPTRELARPFWRRLQLRPHSKEPQCPQHNKSCLQPLRLPTREHVWQTTKQGLQLRLQQCLDQQYGCLPWHDLLQGHLWADQVGSRELAPDQAMARAQASCPWSVETAVSEVSDLCWLHIELRHFCRRCSGYSLQPPRAFTSISSTT